MRALDPRDPAAPLSDRPDHGAAGAFAAWPGATAYGLCRLGRSDIAVGLLRRAHRTTSGGLWGQAVEGTYRVAERGVSNRESVAAVAVTEAVIAGLFGIEAGLGTLAGPPEGVTRTEFGELHGVRGRLRPGRRPAGRSLAPRPGGAAGGPAPPPPPPPRRGGGGGAPPAAVRGWSPRPRRTHRRGRLGRYARRGARTRSHPDPLASGPRHTRASSQPVRVRAEIAAATGPFDVASGLARPAGR
ncbi:hypothetical protein [Streptomyces sp. IBSBF 2435]|uniref:hypothetical protein n=1 Tax=Streptomyces sp. IBSBF 2435 TaxID=2903531 RepID=UPI002FDC3206